MESALKSLYGVKDVTASIGQSGVGEAEVVYVPAEISLEDLKECIASASGEKHDFKVIAVEVGGSRQPT